MQLVVLCVVLAYLCFVTATPHGYGVKGGAAAKAEASAAAGAYSGLGVIPPVPFGPGYSGSFTKSSSSSSASSSASASSSSFSFSGSGYPEVGGECATGICPSNGQYDKNAYPNTGQNSGTITRNQNLNYNTGYPNNAGAYTGAAAQAGAIAGSQVYFGNHNNPCTGNNCFDKQGNCKGPHCNGAGVASPSKTCESGQCFPSASTLPSSIDTNDNNNNCASGQCDGSSEPETIPTNVNLNVDKNQSSNKCQSGQCDSTNPQKCSAGQCSPSLTLPDKPPAFESNSSPHSEEPIKGTTFVSTTIPNSSSTHEYNSKPHLDKPLQGTNSVDNSPYKCTSGQCNPSLSDDTSSDKEDIGINIQKNSNSKSNVNNESNDYEKTVGNGKGPSNCAYGNCASNPTLDAPFNNPGTHPYSSHSVNIETSKCNSPDCKNDIYNHAAAAGGALATAFNKPATYLTAPKQESSCTTPNCKPSGFVAGYHTTGINVPASVSQPNIPYDSKKPFDCAAGQCGNNPPNSYFPSSSINSPTPNDGFSGNKCTTSECASSPHNPSYQSSYSHNVAQPAVPYDTPSYKPTHSQGQFSPSISNPTNKPLNYPQGSSPSYTPFNYPNNISGYKPNQPHSSPSGSSPQVKPDEAKTGNEEKSFPPFVILTTPSPQSCGGNGCSGNLSTKPSFGTNTIATQSNVHEGPLSSPSYTAYPASAPSPCRGNGCSGDLPTKANFGTNTIATQSNVHEGPLSSPSYTAYPASALSPCRGNDCSGDLPMKPNFGTNTIATQSNVHTGLPSSPSYTTYPSSAPSPCGGSGCSGALPTKPNFGSNTIATQSAVHTGLPSSPSYATYPSSAPSPCGGSRCSDALPTKPNFGTNTIASQSAVHTGLPSSPFYTAHPSSAPSILSAVVSHSFDAPLNTDKPSHDSRDKPVYTGGFGGPEGLLKPNDYSLPSTIPAINKLGAGEKLSVPCSTGSCNGNHVPIHNGSPASNAIPAVAQNAATCTTGKCGSQNGVSTNIFNGAHASAGAAASANAVVYSGGFGGPPGFLKPYDGGNVKGVLASLDGKGALLNSASSSSPTYGVHAYNNGAGSGAQAFAAAGAAAGAFGHPGHYGHTDGSDIKGGYGCAGGCSPSGADSNGSGLNSHHNAGLSLAKAGAVSGANAGSFGYGGSFASSSASAHASAGAAVKGYGRR